MRSARGSSGVTLIELMLALCIGLVVFGSALTVFIGESRTYAVQTQVAEMRQNGRNVLEMLSRDLLMAGSGMASMPIEIDAVIANEPSELVAVSSSTVTVRCNPYDVETPLAHDMPQSSAELKVEETAGFTTGMRVMIWDHTGAYDFPLITHVQASADHLQHNTVTLSKAYEVAEQTNVTAVREVTYRHVPGSREVQRQEDAGPWLVVGENVEAFVLRYWDEWGAEIAPASHALRRQVRTIGVSLRVRTTETDRETGRLRTFSLQSEVSPRNLPGLIQL